MDIQLKQAKQQIRPYLRQISLTIMDIQLKQAKQQIRPYLRQISETALWQLCAMAKDGRIEFAHSCKCIRGVAGGGTSQGYLIENSYDAVRAENGLNVFGIVGIYGLSMLDPVRDRYRNLRLLPMVKAEIRRRSRLSPAPEPASALEEVELSI